MRVALTLHPDSRCDAVSAIEVELSRPSAAEMALRYLLKGRIAALRIPQAAPPARTDELWKHTCFELFARAPSGGYSEFNFSPASQWAAYRFDSYRSGMRPLDTAPPRISMEATDAQLELDVRLPCPEKAASLAISAVVETLDGGISYWAVAHAPGRPDFHHADSFVLTLPAPERS